MKTSRTSWRMVLIISALAATDLRGQDEWRDAYKVGDRVELQITGDLWQQCVVTENSPNSVMKGRCEGLVAPPPSTYRRAGGVYILSKSDTRKAGRQSAGGAPIVTKPAPTATSRGPGGGPDSSRGSAFAVGDEVEIEASKHWVPCVVSENQPPSVMRVRCSAYPALSRVAGEYTVDRDNPAAVRRATGRIGLQPTAPPTPRVVPGPAGLRVGEYACYGSGGRILFGFKVLAGNRYADLEGSGSGSFSVSGTSVTFRGGSLGGQVGRDLRGHSFTLASKAECEPY
ncbi:MAG: hypothetical protein JNK60_04680 [Acidobacteria bacterium]|nr:hypothetical protein [Acidobacteriota bacterium]